ncbi:hypothetical protein [Bremerella alba]|nr:hypothetical protein [Bremerella alba]
MATRGTLGEIRKAGRLTHKKTTSTASLTLGMVLKQFAKSIEVGKKDETMHRNLLAPWAVLTGLTIAFPATAAEPAPAPPEMVTFKLSAYEKSDGPTPKLLASPTIMTVTGREVNFRSAGQVKSKFDASPHDIGTQFTAMIHANGNDKYELKLQATLGNLKAPEQDPDTECFIEQKLTLRTIVNSGVTKRINVSPGRWYSITIEKATPNAQPGAGTIPGTSIPKTTNYPSNTSSPAPNVTPTTAKQDPNFRYVEKPLNYVER